MIKTLTQNRIQVVDSISDWKDAIRLCAEPLLKEKCITEAYVDKMIDNVIKLGPYMVLRDFVAMPHSKPEDGVFNTSVSMLKINENLSFSLKDEPIKIIFVLASADSNSHIEIIQNIVEFLEDEDRLEQIFEERNRDNILKLMEV